MIFSQNLHPKRFCYLKVRRYKCKVYFSFFYCIHRLCRTVIQNLKPHIRIQDVEFFHCLKKITVKCRLRSADIDRSVLQRDQITQIILSFEKLGTSCRYISIKCPAFRLVNKRQPSSFSSLCMVRVTAGWLVFSTVAALVRFSYFAT